jgi:ankyrin repeat protein
MGGDWKEMFLGVETNDFDLVRYHISNKIDLNYQHPEFLTSALIESINRNHLEMMAYLLENGALPDLKEVFSNKSPMTIAKELKNKEAVNILNKYLNTSETIEVERKLSFLNRVHSFIMEEWFRNNK